VPLYVTLVSTGTWRGEARGLSGGIAWDAQHIRVRRSLYKGGYYLPKSKESRQRIDVGDQVLGSLRGVERVDYRDENSPRRRGSRRRVVRHQPRQSPRPREACDAPGREVAPSDDLLACTRSSACCPPRAKTIKYISEQMRHASVQITVQSYWKCSSEDATSA
jgi:hypothetical protein